LDRERKRESKGSAKRKGRGKEGKEEGPLWGKKKRNKEETVFHSRKGIEGKKDGVRWKKEHQDTATPT